MITLADHAIPEAVWIALRASLLLAASTVALALLHRQMSAATRHLLWTLALAGTLLLPILAVALPAWTIAVRTAPPVEDGALAAGPAAPDAADPADGDDAAAARASAGSARAPDRADRSWTSVAPALYAGVACLLLLLVAVQRWRGKRLVRATAEVRDADWLRMLAECARAIGVRGPVRLLRSRECSVPLAVGTRRPAVLIPAVADTWPDDRRRAVLLHELAHVARRDCLIETMASAACVLYWFHPGVWWAARRLRIERELACDDRVIHAGAEPRAYAGHLLEIAYSLGGQRVPALAAGMARPRQLEGRLLALLDGRRNRRAPAGPVRLAAAAIAGAILLPLGGARAAVVVLPPDAEPPAPAAMSEAAVLRQPGEASHAARLDPANRPLSRREVRVAPQPAAAAQDARPGTWEIRPTGTEGTVHLRLTELNSSTGTSVPLDRLEGLPAGHLTGEGGPVQFRLRRDAGTFTFEGILRQGVGAGTFSFAPEAGFAGALEKRGFARPSAGEQYQLARHDIGYAFLDELGTQGYARPEVPELVRAGQHGVHLTYLREMSALGYRLGSLAPLITLRDHGVTPAYVRELAELGFKGLSADDIQRARDHGITPDYVRGMRDAGYAGVPMPGLIQARDHGVTVQFVTELAGAGHSKLPLDQLIRVRDHGVSPAYVREMRELGYSPQIDELVRARDHGVTAEYARGLAAAGQAKLPLDTLIRLRDHGVTPQYAQELRTLGYDRLTADDLVMLRSHGLTPDRIRRANERAGTQLTVDRLKSAAAGGIP